MQILALTYGPGIFGTKDFTDPDHYLIGAVLCLALAAISVFTVDRYGPEGESKGFWLVVGFWFFLGVGLLVTYLYKSTSAEEWQLIQPKDTQSCAPLPDEGLGGLRLSQELERTAGLELFGDHSSQV